MSPGLTLRPSLSGALQLVVPETVQGVAGVDAPAFVERTEPYSWFQSDTAVSPGLTLRPSLSDRGGPSTIPSSHTPPGSQAAVFRV